MDAPISLSPSSTIVTGWDTEIFNTDFFIPAFATLCEDDRSSLVQVNQATKEFLIRAEWQCITELGCGLNFIINFCALRQLSGTLEKLTALKTQLSSLPSSLPKISDQFYDAIFLLSKTLGHLAPTVKNNLKDYLLTCRGSFNKNLLCGLFHVPIYSYLHHNLNTVLNTLISSGHYTDGEYSIKLEEVKKTIQLNAEAFENESAFCYEAIDMVIELYNLRFGGFEFLFRDSLGIYLNPIPFTPQSLIAIGRFGPAIKNKFTNITSKKEDTCTCIIDEVVKQGHYAWAEKLIQTMGNNLVATENLATTAGAQIYLNRQNRTKDHAYITIARSVSLDVAIELIDKISDAIIKSRAVEEILFKAGKPDYQGQMTDVVSTLEKKDWFITSIQIAYQREIQRYHANSSTLMPACAHHNCLFNGDEYAVAYACLCWLVKLSDEGYPEKALSLLDYVDIPKSFEHIAQRIALAAAKKENLQKAS